MPSLATVRPTSVRRWIWLQGGKSTIVVSWAPLAAGQPVMVAEHWNGSAWSQVPTPNVVRFDEKLNAVSAAAANDVWAVGSTNRTAFAHTDPLAAHWDGTRWTIVPTPTTTGGSKSILFGVANLGGGNAWAVGRSAANRALVEHWNGSAWTIIRPPTRWHRPAARSPAAH
jgi:hypothetical protein